MENEKSFMNPKIYLMAILRMEKKREKPQFFLIIMKK